MEYEMEKSILCGVNKSPSLKCRSC